MEELFIPKDWAHRGNLITVVGVGGGGSNAVTYMYKQGIKDVDFVICNTDIQALEMSPVPRKLQIGEVTTRGLGAGTDYLVGRKAAQESKDEIGTIFGKDTQMVFVTCGMGGGTGTGAAPVVAQVAKEKGLLTVGVVTIPFRDEGNEALYRAKEGINELNKNVDCTLIIDNEKLYLIYGSLNVFSAFPKADEVLATAVKSIAEIITSGGYINMDFADVKKIMQNSGVAIMGIGESSGPDRAKIAVEQAFHSPLLNDFDLSTVKNALVNITSSSGEYAVTMEELSQIMEYTKNFSGGKLVNFKRGIVKNDEIGEKLSITIVATGLKMAELPICDINPVDLGERIEVSVAGDAFAARRKGAPIVPDREVIVNRKPGGSGRPVLLTEDPQELAALESEPAYSRLEQNLSEPDNQENQ